MALAPAPGGGGLSPQSDFSLLHDPSCIGVAFLLRSTTHESVALPPPPAGETWELGDSGNGHKVLFSDSEEHWATDFVKVNLYTADSGAQFVVDRTTSQATWLDKWETQNMEMTWAARTFSRDGMRIYLFDNCSDCRVWYSLQDLFMALRLGEKNEAWPWWTARWNAWEGLASKLKLGPLAFRKAMPYGSGEQNYFGSAATMQQGRVPGAPSTSTAGLVMLLASRAHSNKNQCGCYAIDDQTKSKGLLVQLIAEHKGAYTVRINTPGCTHVLGQSVGTLIGFLDVDNNSMVDMKSLVDLWRNIHKSLKPKASRILPFNSILNQPRASVADLLIALLQCGTPLR
jgi:hypothetical protein